MGARQFVLDKFVFGDSGYQFAVWAWGFGVGVLGLWAWDEFWGRKVTDLSHLPCTSSNHKKCHSRNKFHFFCHHQYSPSHLLHLKLQSVIFLYFHFLPQVFIFHIIFGHKFQQITAMSIDSPNRPCALPCACNCNLVEYRYIMLADNLINKNQYLVLRMMRYQRKLCNLFKGILGYDFY